MAGNIFDQFDEPAPSLHPGGVAKPPVASLSGGNVFDQFDTPAASKTPMEARGGFASRAQREGNDAQMRQAEYFADALRAREQPENLSKTGAFIRGAGSWVPGLDKLAAASHAMHGIGKGGSFSERYDDNLTRERAISDADEALNPGTRLAGQAAGLVGTAVALPGLNLVKEGVRGAAAINTAATGGLYGALTGGIETDGGVGDKALGAATGGITGLALGAVAPSIISGVGAAARGVGNLASAVARPFRSAFTPEAEAARRINAALARDGVTDPAGSLAGMRAQGAPAVIADVGGETTRALARSAANLSPEGREVLTAATSDRFAGQGSRITELLRGFGPSSAGKSLDELQAAARAANHPAYRKAYVQGGSGLWTPELQNLAQAPAVQDAIRIVIKTGANKTVADGMPPIRNPFTTDSAGNLTLARNADGSIATPNLQFWDYVQRELRGKAGEAARAGNKDLAGDFTNLRRALVNQLDNAVPAFQEARSGAARYFQAEDALEAGQKFVTSRMANEEAREAFAKLSPAERELFAEGFRSDLIAKIREVGDGRDVVKAIFGSAGARERVSIALGPSQAAGLEAALKTETAMLKLQVALGNSTTMRQMLESGLIAGTPSALGGAVGYYQGGSPGAVAGALAGAALRQGRMKLDTGLAKKIGEMLASGDVKQLQTVTKMAVKSPAVMRFLEGFTDEAGKVVGLNSHRPLEVTVRPGTVPGYMPAAADQEKQ